MQICVLRSQRCAKSRHSAFQSNNTRGSTGTRGAGKTLAGRTSGVLYQEEHRTMSALSRHKLLELEVM